MLFPINVFSNYQFFEQNYGEFFDLSGAGVTGPVQLRGSTKGSATDLSSQKWTYQVGYLFDLEVASYYY